MITEAYKILRKQGNDFYSLYGKQETRPWSKAVRLKYNLNSWNSYQNSKLFVFKDHESVIYYYERLVTDATLYSKDWNNNLVIFSCECKNLIFPLMKFDDTNWNLDTGVFLPVGTMLCDELLLKEIIK